MNKILIPILRRIVPNMIANDIVGVQPMYNPDRENYLLDSGVSYDPQGEMPEWYWVKCYNISATQYNAMRKFCGDTFGIRGGDLWTSNDESFQFLFTYEQDQMMFLLRWAK